MQSGKKCGLCAHHALRSPESRAKVVRPAVKITPHYRNADLKMVTSNDNHLTCR